MAAPYTAVFEDGNVTGSPRGSVNATLPLPADVGAAILVGWARLSSQESANAAFSSWFPRWLASFCATFPPGMVRVGGFFYPISCDYLRPAPASVLVALQTLR